MKVRMTVTVDIDPESWTLNYGIEDRSEIREDVKMYVRDVVENAMQNSLGVPVTAVVR